MCGIAGFRSPPNKSPDELARIAKAMGDSLSHRGPDDDGIWVDAETGIALSHRRLSIIDLSAAGHQPMVSSDGRFVMVYNCLLYTSDAADE